MSLRCRENPPPESFSRLGRMPHPAAASLFAALLTAIALLGCGEEDAQLLPGGTAREITANLDTVQRLADEGDCIGAESAAGQVSEQVEAIEGVDARLERALREGAARLNEVVAGCEEGEEAIAPDTTEAEAEAADGEDEKDREKREKAEEKAEKAQEKEEEKARKEGEKEAESPSLPPQAEGEGKGLGDGEGSGPGEDEEGGGTPAGGVSAGSPAGSEDGN
jgi:hypothetical protein